MQVDADQIFWIPALTMFDDPVKSCWFNFLQYSTFIISINAWQRFLMISVSLPPCSMSKLRVYSNLEPRLHQDYTPGESLYHGFSPRHWIDYKKRSFWFYEIIQIHYDACQITDCLHEKRHKNYHKTEHFQCLNNGVQRKAKISQLLTMKHTKNNHLFLQSLLDELIRAQWRLRTRVKETPWICHVPVVRWSRSWELTTAGSVWASATNTESLTGVSTAWLLEAWEFCRTGKNK